jgi:DNA mismatch repair protein MutS
MAGLPIQVINRANIVLKKLALEKETNLDCKDIDQMEINFYDSQDSTIEELKSIDIDNITPLEALVELKKIKDKYDK